MHAKIPDSAGIYLLLVRTAAHAELQIGRAGTRTFAPGLYGYGEAPVDRAGFLPALAGMRQKADEVSA